MLMVALGLSLVVSATGWANDDGVAAEQNSAKQNSVAQESVKAESQARTKVPSFKRAQGRTWGRRKPPGFGREPARDAKPLQESKPTPTKEPPFSSPLMRVLDQNADGVLTRAEIEAATDSLLRLDMDRDGQVTSEEIRRLRPSGPWPLESRRAAASVAPETKIDAVSPRENEVDAARAAAIERMRFGNRESRRRIPPGFTNRTPPPTRGPSTAPQEPAADVGQQVINIVMSHDKNGDGKVDAQELPSRLRPMLDRFDRNGDQALERHELEAPPATSDRRQ